MFSLLSTIRSILVSGAFAQAPQPGDKGINSLGAGSPGVATMWEQIMSVFPYSKADANLPQIIAARIIDLVTNVVGIAAVIAIVYAGVLVTSAGGDDGKLSQAKTTIMYALVGVAIVMLGQLVMLYMCGTIFPIIFSGESTCFEA